MQNMENRRTENALHGEPKILTFEGFGKMASIFGMGLWR